VIKGPTSYTYCRLLLMNKFRPRTAITVGVLALLSHGCSHGDDRLPAVVRVDSSGIAVVVNHLSESPNGAWRVSDEPAVTIGVADGLKNYQFHQVAGVHRLTGRTIVVGDAGSNELRLFSTDGQFIRAAGGSGGGPGEFRELSSTYVYNDTVFVYDLRLQRMSIFDNQLNYVGSLSFAGTRDGLPPQPLGRFADGSWVAAWTTFGNSLGLVRGRTLYYRVAADGSAADPIGYFPGPETIQQPVSRVGAYQRHVPFGRSPSATILDTAFVYGSADTYELEIRGADGTLKRLIRRSFVPEPISPEDLALWEAENEVPTDLPPSSPSFLTEPASSLPLPPTKAVYSDIRADPTGTLWVGEYAFPNESPKRWALFDASGRWLGQVSTPDRFHLMEIGEGYVLGVHEDEYGVEYVRMYSFVRPRD
jgi:hypothetical protein